MQKRQLVIIIRHNYACIYRGVPNESGECVCVWGGGGLSMTGKHYSYFTETCRKTQIDKEETV